MTRAEAWHDTANRIDRLRTTLRNGDPKHHAAVARHLESFPKPSLRMIDEGDR